MKPIGNTLYVTSPDMYLSLDGENVVIFQEKTLIKRIPLHNLTSIVTFGYTGASPALMGACIERNIALSFLTKHGRFISRITGKSNGNVLLRRKQYRIADDEVASLPIAQNMIIGKVYNCKWVIERAIRDHKMIVNAEKLKEISRELSKILKIIPDVKSLEELRGYEGKAAVYYFSIFNDLILQQKDEFYFQGRNKRPPLDNINALLSFSYTLLAHDMASALEVNGLDSYVGFFHTDRPGRISLALDMMEELRPILADRFVLQLVNKKMINGKGFKKKENGAVIMNDETRKVVLTQWQSRKNDILTHPFLNEKVSWGHVTFIQAQLLARMLRDDLEAYPPFLWK